MIEGVSHMDIRLTRRAFATTAASLFAVPFAVRAQESSWAWTLPIGYPGEVLGDGFFVRHGFATENFWYNPGWYHAAEDYYVLDGNAAGAHVYAVADGEVVFAGSEYPGLVVIVQHEESLYSMYGHLAHDWAVESGPVRRGQLIGTVYDRTDGRAPSHLHFEIRTFLSDPQINGLSPRYDAGCTFDCPPGPGYWPMGDSDHPAEMGWRNPMHVIANRAFNGDIPSADADVIVAQGAGPMARLWSGAPDDDGAQAVDDLALEPGARYRLLEIAAGPEDSVETSAEAYRVWYRILITGREAGLWVQAALPSANDTGADGRPSSVQVDFLPYVMGEG
jgi:murein DD-endopeptidase MepM/ murein hydrolase activator NlpD